MAIGEDDGGGGVCGRGCPSVAFNLDRSWLALHIKGLRGVRRNPGCVAEDGRIWGVWRPFHGDKGLRWWIWCSWPRFIAWPERWRWMWCFWAGRLRLSDKDGWCWLQELLLLLLLVGGLNELLQLVSWLNLHMLLLKLLVASLLVAY
ncbi:hypothetical protein DAI22_07g032600 [Oryza sativa Japonica Group]|nr:hypothetical protein DAI22_07g032600 [Oryza sativa Japonica Group]